MELIIGLLTTLILGAYAWTWQAFSRVNVRIDEILNNHVKHIHERLDKLETYHTDL